jgi:DNA-binding transcriptional MerR regulator
MIFCWGLVYDSPKNVLEGKARLIAAAGIARRGVSAILDKAPEAFRTISEVADDLDVPQHVLRFWESRFAQIKPMKRGGGRRYYRPEDIDLLRGIRFLLYSEGYTIRGVQRILREQGVRFVQSVWREGANNLELGSVPEGEEAEVQEASGPSMLGLLSNFHDSDEPQGEHQEQTDGERTLVSSGPLHITSDKHSTHVGTSNCLTRDDIHRLHTTLRDLNECRRILDAALKHDDA